jgi:DNA-directed RNA polymerase subunit RPC12/RpoP
LVQEKIVFNCPSCGVKLQVEEDRAGIAARCPGCGKRINIPQKNKKNK